MIRRIVNARYLALALLVLAHLSVTVHAAEHGVGPHTHDGAPCLYGAANDDDSDGSIEDSTFVLLSTASGFDAAACPDAVNGRSDLRIPPATGPPGSA